MLTEIMDCEIDFHEVGNWGNCNIKEWTILPTDVWQRETGGQRSGKVERSYTLYPTLWQPSNTERQLWWWIQLGKLCYVMFIANYFSLRFCQNCCHPFVPKVPILCASIHPFVSILCVMCIHSSICLHSVCSWDGDNVESDRNYCHGTNTAYFRLLSSRLYRDGWVTFDFFLILISYADIRSQYVLVTLIYDFY